MSNNVLITAAGLNYVTSAHTKGTLINIAYFVPVYDYRLDPTIQSTVTTSAFSAAFDPNASSPFGEIIWNRRGYNMLNKNNVLLSAGNAIIGGGGTVLTFQSSLQSVNGINGVPLSNSISATNGFTIIGNTSTTNSWTGLPVATTVGGINPIGNKFSTVDYYPVTDT